MYVDNAGGDAIGKSLSDFLSAAKSGGFAVNDYGGQALLNACRDMRDWIDDNRIDIERLTREPQLGSSNAANVLKPYVAAVGSDAEGFATRLMEFREALIHAEEAIHTAMADKLTFARSAVLAVLLTTTTACSTETAGTALPGQSTNTSTPTASPSTSAKRPTSTKPAPNDSPLTDTDPCTLLPDAGKTELGLSGSGEPDDIGSGRGCKWRLRGPKDTYIFGVDIYDTLGIKDLPNDINNRQLPNIGDRPAVETGLTGAETCSVTMGVTETSRVSTTAVAGVDRAKACQLALRLAELIEPGLP
ncbi:DUF3558 domain-containing protein [Actinokineospora sp.]|uniref:DUF3558 domain-containing protein n=1 Tax=Actinokineospora sp. TaxID=1872133 RepID=UPI0040381E51